MSTLWRFGGADVLRGWMACKNVCQSTFRLTNDAVDGVFGIILISVLLALLLAFKAVFSLIKDLSLLFLKHWWVLLIVAAYYIYKNFYN